MPMDAIQEVAMLKARLQRVERQFRLMLDELCHFVDERAEASPAGMSALPRNHDLSCALDARGRRKFGAGFHKQDQHRRRHK